jgi:hypothetical protein
MMRAMLGMVMVLAMAGAAAGQGTVTINKIAATRYEAMIEPVGSMFKGEVVVYEKVVKAPEGKALVRLEMDLAAKWAEKREQINLTPDAVAITADGGPVEVLGYGNSPGLITVEQTPRIGLFPPLTGPAELPSILSSWVIAVPQAAKQVTVKIGSQTRSAAIPATVLKAGGKPDLEIKVTGAKLVDSIPLGGTTETLKNDGGKLLVVTFKYTPKPADLKASYTFATTALNVRAGKTVAGCEGYIFSGSLTRAGSYSATTPPAFWASLPPLEAVFKVPADTTAFDLTWLGQAIAKGAVGK